MTDVVTELGRIAAEMDEVAHRWSTLEADSPGPALLSHWRTRLVLAAMELRDEPPQRL